MCLQEHLEKFCANTGIYPQDVIADAGYGSEENYVWMQENEIEGYIKYNSFHYERKRNYKKKHPYQADAFICHTEEDEYECPEGKRLIFEEERNRAAENGYQSKRKVKSKSFRALSSQLAARHFGMPPLGRILRTVT